MVIFEYVAPLGVVPIVVNAGAALLPAMLAGAASFVALLFKPREMIRACKDRPGRFFGVVGAIAAITAVIWFWPSPAPEGGERSARARVGNTTAASDGGVTVDWTRVALARIAADRLGPQQAVAEAVATPVGTEPFILCGGPKRLGSVDGKIDGALQLAWSYYPRWNDDGVEQEDREAMVLSSPAVWGDRVFGASCTLDPPESFGAVFCLDAATGRQIWTIDQADDEPFKGFFSSPAISGDGKYLLIGQGLHPDSNCRLICIETATGRVHWTHEVSLHIESSPCIDGDIVYVGAGAIEDPETHQPISHSGFVMAVRISDGKELWRVDVNDPESSPVFKDGILYIGSGFNGKAVVALKVPPNGEGEPERIWSAPSSHPVTGAVTMGDGVVFAGGGNGDFVFRDPNPAGMVKAIKVDDGSELWSAELPDAVLGAVAASSRLICPVASGEVIALDLKTGEPVWRSKVSGKAPVLAATAVTETEVFAVSQNGYLGRMNLETGESIERIYINAEDKPGEQGLSISSPLVVGGRLFVGSETGGFRCYIGGGKQ
ncbi:MAG: PQQ-binding-like beta-propeller repeat protein [Verrucomicrobiaceae bacterium]